MINAYNRKIKRTGAGLLATLFFSIQLLFGFVGSSIVSAQSANAELHQNPAAGANLNNLPAAAEIHANAQAAFQQATEAANLNAEVAANAVLTAEIALGANVTLCHATGSATNPYVVITVNAAGAFNGHLGAGHQNGEDIIPPFTFNGQVHSQNWNASGQAIFNNGCVPPVVVVDVCPNIEGVQATVPVGMVKNNAGLCVILIVDTANVTLCHATGSTTNPYVIITVSAAGAFNGHLGAGHQNGEDIIPPFVYNGQTYSQNWNAAGQAIFNNGCVPPVVNPVDVCPNIPGVQTTIPVGMVKNNAGNCVVVVIPADNVTLCHATGSTTNPYVIITVSAAGAFNGHLGAGHQNGEDIIPPFTYNGQVYSQNWNAAGQAIFNNGCVPPTTTPTDVCPNIPGAQTTIPVGMVKNNAGNCVVPVTPVIVTPPPITGGQGGGVVLAATTTTTTPQPTQPAATTTAPPEQQLVNTGISLMGILAAVLALVTLGAAATFATPKPQTK